MATKKGYYGTNTTLGEMVRKMESDFNSGEVRMSKYVSFSAQEDIDKIYAYLESKHTSGETDSLGREKPFFNIVLAARNIWFRSTDIDRSNIKARATKSADTMGSLLITVLMQDWMRREDFGTFLNNWGINSAGFNESVLKFVKQAGRLIPSVVPWSKMIFDPIDFEGNPKVEVLELTEAQLRKRKGYDKTLVEKLCTALSARETVGKEQKDNKADYIKLYEVHGELPLSYVTGNEEDEEEYAQQMHVLSFIASKEKGDYDDYCLYSGLEEKDPYMIGALLPEIDGSIALRGSVKTLFDAQWMQNHSAKAIKDQLDLASKLIFQTSDPTFVGQNVLSAIENGDILIHRVNEPLTSVTNRADISALQSYASQWKSLGNEITGISESMLGIAPKSGTAWRQTEALLQENHSLFELMTQNKGLVIERIMREFVIPYLKTKIDTSDEVAAILQDHDIKKIDARFIKNIATREANKAIKDFVLKGGTPTQGDQEQLTTGIAQSAQELLAEQGTERFFKPSDISDATWKEALRDIEWEISVDVTGEDVDKDALTTLNTVLNIVTDPVRAQALNTPMGRTVFNKILELTKTLSPAEVADIPSQPVQPTPVAPTQQDVGLPANTV